MKLRILLISALILSLCISAQSQEKGDADKAQEPVKYLPVHRYPFNILHVYRFTDTTVVTRMNPDSTIVKYTRELTHFFTLKQAKAASKGFVTLEVSIDSTRYRIKEGNAEIYWDSQDDKAGGINMQDLKYSTVPLGKYFDMTFSPYGEIAKIEGEKIDWFIDYLNQYADQLPDTVEKFIWYDGVSLPRLGNITSLKKIKFPDNKIEIDSTWDTPFSMQFEFITFSGNMKAKISKFDNGELYLQGFSDNLQPAPGKYLINGFQKILLPVEMNQNNVVYNLHLSPRGAIKSAEAIADIQLDTKIRKDTFGIHIKSKVRWDLLGQYRE